MASWALTDGMDARGPEVMLELGAHHLITLPHHAVASFVPWWAEGPAGCTFPNVPLHVAAF